MNITFLVGNGFDISAGIDTSYGAFYKWYCSQPSREPFIEKFKREIMDDIEHGGKTWADFEMGLGKYTAKFTPDNADNFLECCEDAHEGIISFLEQTTRRFDLDNISEKEKSLSDGILNFYQELQPLEKEQIRNMISADSSNNMVFNIISFNYTDVLDKCIKAISASPLKEWTNGTSKRYAKIARVLHIHGTADEYPILGVSNETQIANQELLSVPYFCSTMIKSQSVASVGETWYTSAEKLIDDSRIICIFGMSLGASDTRWWDKINLWLKGNSNRHLVIFWHTDKIVSRRSVYRYNQELDKVKSLMISHSIFPESAVDTVKERIHVVFNTKSVLRTTLSTLPKVATAS